MKNKTISKDVFSLSFFLKKEFILSSIMTSQRGGQTCFTVSSKEAQVLGWHWPRPQGHPCHIGETGRLSMGVLKLHSLISHKTTHRFS